MTTLRVSIILALSCVIAVSAAGCFGHKDQTPALYTDANPGPWKSVNKGIAIAGNRITIDVQNFPKSPNNYVLKFNLVDQRGMNVGERVFQPEEEPKETFILDPETKLVTITIISTGQGEWVSDAKPVPAP